MSEKIIVRASNPGLFETEANAVSHKSCPARTHFLFSLSLFLSLSLSLSLSLLRAVLLTRGQHWVRGESLNSIFHHGPVGINVESPEDALCVRGNIRYAHVQDPSPALKAPGMVSLGTDRETGLECSLLTSFSVCPAQCCSRQTSV
jgi:hypothetical protein